MPGVLYRQTWEIGMRRIQLRHRQFWVGTLVRRNSDEVGLVVFDAAVQPPTAGPNYVDLFEVADGNRGNFRKDVVRELLGEPNGFSASAIQSAVDAYCRAVGIDPEAEWQAMLNAERRLQERHAEYLRSVAIPNRGNRRNSHRHRETPCYCKEAYLDNSIQTECVGCGGIICYTCAGCLCGR